jgi:SOS-response transcriptional repressor LexA
MIPLRKETIMDADYVKARFDELQIELNFSARGLADALQINRYSINKVLTGDLHTRKLRSVFHQVLNHLNINEDQFMKRKPLSPRPAKTPTPVPDAREQRIPLYGEIPAGHASLVEGFPETSEYFDPVKAAKSHRVFALRVWGDSMTPRLLQNDIVILEPLDIFIGQKNPERPAPGLLFEKLHGRIVSALVDGEATLKALEYVPKKGSDDFELFLVPLNTRFARIRIQQHNEVRIQGVVVGFFRSETGNVLQSSQGSSSN